MKFTTIFYASSINVDLLLAFLAVYGDINLVSEKDVHRLMMSGVENINR